MRSPRSRRLTSPNSLRFRTDSRHIEMRLQLHPRSHAVREREGNGFQIRVGRVHAYDSTEDAYITRLPHVPEETCCAHDGTSGYITIWPETSPA